MSSPSSLPPFFLPLPSGTRRQGRTPEPTEPALHRLSHYLLAHYQKGIRPVRDWRTTTNVAIDLMVYAILSVVSPLLPSQLLGCLEVGSFRVSTAREGIMVCSILLARSAHLLE